MNYRVALSLSFLCLTSSWAAPVSLETGAGLFPNSHEIFRPLRADPRELQYAARLVIPVSHKLLGEAAIGDYFGLYRWVLPNEGLLQLNIGGGVFGLFDLAGTSNDMQSADFYANLPLDYRKGNWSTRFMLYHMSSHLGDDYVKRTGIPTQKHSRDNLRWLLSYSGCESLRLYGGYTYIFRTLPGSSERNALQTGMETYSPWLAGGHAQLYWGNDLQFWQRTGWNPIFTSQAGIKIRRNAETGRALSIFIEFFSGHDVQDQFFLDQQTRWALGLKFDFN